MEKANMGSCAANASPGAEPSRVEQKCLCLRQAEEIMVCGISRTGEQVMISEYSHRSLSSKMVHADVKEDSLKKVLCNVEIMCNPGKWTSGNSCSRNVVVRRDWWNVFGVSLAAGLSCFYSCFIIKKVRKWIISQQFLYLFIYLCNQWSSTNISMFGLRPKPLPNLQILRIKRWSRQCLGALLLLVRTSASQEWSVPFDIHPTSSSDEHKYRAKCIQGAPSDCLFCFVRPAIPRSARGHTLCCRYLSQLIAVIKQWECSQECVDAALDGILSFTAQPGCTADGVRGRRLNDTKANLASILQFCSRAGTTRQVSTAVFLKVKLGILLTAWQKVKWRKVKYEQTWKTWQRITELQYPFWSSVCSLCSRLSAGKTRPQRAVLRGPYVTQVPSGWHRQSTKDLV